MIERTTDFDGLLKWYLSVVESAENEDTKADRFRDFVRRAFPEIDVGSIGGFYPELEKYVKYWGHGRLIKGRPDSLFGNLVIEFENVLDDRHLEEAESQLRKYIAALWSIGKIRSEIKNHLRKEIEEINELTKQVLGIT